VDSTVETDIRALCALLKQRGLINDEAQSTRSEKLRADETYEPDLQLTGSSAEKVDAARWRITDAATGVFRGLQKSGGRLCRGNGKKGIAFNACTSQNACREKGYIST
jgi:hypothetical protein